MSGGKSGKSIGKGIGANGTWGVETAGGVTVGAVTGVDDTGFW